MCRLSADLDMHVRKSTFFLYYDMMILIEYDDI